MTYRSQDIPLVLISATRGGGSEFLKILKLFLESEYLVLIGQVISLKKKTNYSIGLLSCFWDLKC